MAKRHGSKHGKLSGMQDVAGEGSSKNNNEVNGEVEGNDDSKVVTVNEAESELVNSIDAIVDRINNKEQPKKKRQVSFYLDEDVAKAFDRYARKKEKGAKSELLEELLKPTLHKMGYMK